MTLTLAEILILSVSIVSIVSSIVGVRQSNRRYRLKLQRIAVEERHLAQGGGARGSNVSDLTCEDFYSMLSDMVRRIEALKSSGSPDAGAHELIQEYSLVVRNALVVLGPDDAREALSILQGELRGLNDRMSLDSDYVKGIDDLIELDLLTKGFIRVLDGVPLSSPDYDYAPPSTFVDKASGLNQLSKMRETLISTNNRPNISGEEDELGNRWHLSQPYRS